MATGGNTSFERLTNRILNLPLWIKQVIFAELKSNLECSSARFTLETIHKDDALQLYVPLITFLGRKELETKSRKLSQETYKFLDGCNRAQRVLDICIENNWNLESCAIHMLNCTDQELVSPASSALISGTAQYIAGRIRLGEYLIKLSKISIDQLDQALRTQKYIEHSIGERTGLAEVLINLGYITRQDTEGILFLKEESRKKYTPDHESLDSASSSDIEEFKKIARENIELKQKLEKLTNENVQIREQLKRLLKLK